MTEYKIFNTIAVIFLYYTTIHAIVVLPFIMTWKTFAFFLVCGSLAGFGVTAGAHRLWCHRSYKATVPLRIFLAFCFSLSGQNSIYDWVRDHRVHHKNSDTPGDPHDITRGFFFAHVGWLMQKKHPLVIEEGRKMDMSDIEQDIVAYYHTKYFWVFKLSLAYFIPYFIPYYFWNEPHYVNFLAQMFRYSAVLNFTWSVNSFAHLYGDKPYNKKIFPSENKWVSFFALGEGWHNYHHMFPWDYSTSEFGFLNATKMWLDIFEKLGMVYDKKTASKTLVESIKFKNL